MNAGSPGIPNSGAPDLVLLGNLLVDDIVLEDGRTFMGEPGGAMLHTALAARLWGASVGLVTIAGSDYPTAALAALRERGVHLDGVRHLDHPGVRTWLLYESAGRRVIHHLERPTHLAVSPEPADIPGGWFTAPVFHVCPMPLDRQRELVAALAGTLSLISLDPHEPISAESLPAWRSALGGVRLLLAGEDEIPLEGGAADPARTVERLAAPDLELVAFKLGARGGVLWDVASRRRRPWLPVPAEVVDPTGAGDAFAGGLLAGLVTGLPLGRALRQGAVAASFAIEAPGARGLLAATPEAATRRAEEFARA